jgi:5-(carboxyamino)imidazole ribonucleotide mutase
MSSSGGSETIHGMLVAVVMGSESDFSVMKEATEALRELGIAFTAKVVSAHRMPDEMAQFAKNAVQDGYNVIIAGAGGAAHLPGMIAAQTTLPVIGVPVPKAPLQGQDALYSIVQMPRGVPVATVAIGGAYNAGLLAAQILASARSPEALELTRRLEHFRHTMHQKALASRLPL